MSYKALALQLTCQTVNSCQNREEAEAVMLQTIERIEQQITASVGLLAVIRCSLWHRNIS